MNLWGVSVSEKQERLVEIPSYYDLLITRLSLVPGAPANQPTVVYLVNHDQEDDEPYVLGTLRAERCEQFEVDVNVVADSQITLKVTGPGTVHFVGYFHPQPDEYDDLDSDEYDLDDEEVHSGEQSSDSDSDDEDEQDEELEKRIAEYMGGGDSSSGEDYLDDRVEEVTDSDDSDIDVEEEDSHKVAQLKSPIKQKQAQSIEPKAGHGQPQKGQQQKGQKHQQQAPKQPGTKPSPPKPQGQPQQGQKQQKHQSPQAQKPQGQKQQSPQAGEGKKKKNKKNKNPDQQGQKRKEGGGGDGHKQKKQKTA